MRLTILLLALPLVASAAPDDRGPRGAYVGVGGGLALGNAVDEDERDGGAMTGFGAHLRFGEEILPRFTLGLSLGGLSATGNNDAYEAMIAGFLLEATWRPAFHEHLVLCAGTGVGAATIDGKGDSDYDGANGGALFGLGLGYELSAWGDDQAGLFLIPSVQLRTSPATSVNDTQVSAFLLGVDALWFTGR